MSSEHRTDSITRAIATQSLWFAATTGAVGVSFGAIAVAAGISVPVACAMSIVVFAGGSQLAAVGVIGAGGSPVAAVASALLLNARYVGLGIAVAPRLAEGSLVRRAIGAHLLIDETGALALAQRDPALARRALWISGLAIFVLWNA